MEEYKNLKTKEDFHQELIKLCNEFFAIHLEDVAETWKALSPVEKVNLINKMSNLRKKIEYISEKYNELKEK
jgi:hypothetical protein